MGSIYLGHYVVINKFVNAPLVNFLAVAFVFLDIFSDLFFSLFWSPFNNFMLLRDFGKKYKIQDDLSTTATVWENLNNSYVTSYRHPLNLKLKIFRRTICPLSLAVIALIFSDTKCLWSENKFKFISKPFKVTKDDKSFL